MRKFLPFLMMLFILNSLCGQIRDFNYKVIYKLTYQPDSTDLESQKQEDMFLYIGDGFSRFSSAGKTIGDSIKSNMNRSDYDQANYVRMRKQIPKTAFEYYLYKGLPKEKIIYTREIIDDKYHYAEDQNLFDWNILKETDTVAGFRVQKATTSFAGRKYTAWFTEELPFPEGPYKFNGLPGLIVKIGDEKEHYIFELVGIRKLKNPVHLNFEMGEFIETSQEKLLELELEFRRDPVGYMQRSMPDATIEVQYKSKEHKNKIERERKEKFRRQNNPIELE